MGSRGTNVLRDMSGYGNHGVLVNDVVSETHSVLGSVLHYDGTNDHVAIADRDAFSPVTTGQLSVAVWHNREQSATEALLAKASGVGAFEWQLVMDGLDRWFVFLFTLAGAIFMSTSIGAGAVVGPLFHLCFTCDINAPFIRIYLDGRRVNQNAATAGAMGNGVSPVWIGERPDGASDFRGIIGDARIANVAWTDAEVWHQFARRWDLYKTPMVPRARSPLAFLAERGVLRGAWRGIYRGM